MLTQSSLPGPHRFGPLIVLLIARKVSIMAISDTVSSAQADLEKLVTDVRTLLASKDLDAILAGH